MEKAFDRVWYAGSVKKVTDFGIPGGLVRLLSNYLRGRTYQVSITNTRSVPRNAMAGVPHGLIRSPILYSIYSANIPTSPRTEVALFVDDTLILATHSNARA